jgi:hypothetical protein
VLLFCRSFEYLIDLLVLRAYQAYMATVGPGKPAGDAAALDAVLSKFLELLPCLQGDSSPIIWDMHYPRQTADQVTPSLIEVHDCQAGNYCRSFGIRPTSAELALVAAMH